MNDKQLSLDVIDVASPCHAAWEGMEGDDLVRRCGQCQKNVYNLSGMSRSAAEAFVAKRGGENAGGTCVRFFRRADGTVLTRDCPVGLRAARQRLVRAVAALAGVFIALASGTLFGGRLSRLAPASFRSPSQAFGHWIQPEQPVELLLGKMVCPTTPPDPILLIPPICEIRAEPAESPLPEPTAEQLEEIQNRLME